MAPAAYVAHLFSNERERKGVASDEEGGGENLKGVVGGETVIRTYCMRKIYLLLKKKKNKNRNRKIGKQKAPGEMGQEHQVTSSCPRSWNSDSGHVYVKLRN